MYMDSSRGLFASAVPSVNALGLVFAVFLQLIHDFLLRNNHLAVTTGNCMVFP